MERNPVRDRADDLGGSVGSVFSRRLQRLFAEWGGRVGFGEPVTYARRRVPSERPATLRSASSGGPAASGAGRAIPTVGRETSGGRGVVRVWCGAVRNLPYARSTVVPVVHEGLKPSTSIRGGAG